MIWCRTGRSTAAAVVAGVVVLSAVAVGLGSAEADTSGADGATVTLYVDADGEDPRANYRTIQGALDDASAGDMVVVLPGSYEEELTINRSVRLVGREGAVLSNPTGGVLSTGVSVEEDAAPTVAGLTIEGFGTGIDVAKEDAGWAVRNVTVRDALTGIDAANSDGEWTVAGTGFRDVDTAVDATFTGTAWTVSNVTVQGAAREVFNAEGANGAWAIRDTAVAEVDGGDAVGVDAENADGAWSLVNVTIVDVSGEGAVGIDARETDGDWLVAGSTVENATADGLLARDSTGAWTVRDSTVTRHDGDGIDAAGSSGPWRVRSTALTLNAGWGVYATGTTGTWTVRNASIVFNGGEGVNATGANPEGNATGNYWGQPGGPDSGQCVGNVTCGDSLSDSPTGDGNDEDDTGTLDLTSITYNETRRGELDRDDSVGPRGPEEYVTFNGSAGDEIRLTMNVTSPPPHEDPYMFLQGPDGRPIVRSEIGPDPTTLPYDAETVTLPSDGTYTVRTTSTILTDRSAYDIENATFTYELTLTAVSMTSGNGTEATDYDTDGDGSVAGDLTGVLQAVSDYNDGEIDQQLVLRVIAAYNGV